MDLTHFDQDGNAWMVDVSDKDITSRTAVLKVLLPSTTLFMSVSQQVL